MPRPPKLRQKPSVERRRGPIAAQEDKLLTATAKINAFKEQLFGASTQIAELMVAAEQSATELTECRLNAMRLFRPYRRV